MFTIAVSPAVSPALGARVRVCQATGVPVLFNTSYNLRGEPIVTTPQEAIKTFAASDIDQLVMGPFLVQKPDTYRATGSHLGPDQVD